MEFAGAAIVDTVVCRYSSKYTGCFTSDSFVRALF